MLKTSASSCRILIRNWSLIYDRASLSQSYRGEVSFSPAASPEAGEHAIESQPNIRLVPEIGISDLLILLSIWMQIPVFFIPICDKLTLISDRSASCRIVRCLSKSNLELPRILPALILQSTVRNGDSRLLSLS